MLTLKDVAHPDTSRGLIGSQGYDKAGFVYEHNSSRKVFREHQLRAFVAKESRDPANVPQGLEDIREALMRKISSGRLVAIATPHPKDNSEIITQNYSRHEILEKNRGR